MIFMRSLIPVIMVFLISTSLLAQEKIIPLEVQKISPNIEMFDYCQFKPQNQKIDIEEIKTVYKSLDLDSLIEKSLDNIEEYNLF